MPLRLSIPLIEKASLEDAEALSEMWSPLLADTAKEVEERHYLLSKVLSSLTPQSAGLLDCIVGDFYKKEEWYDELMWEEDWLQDLEAYILKEVEPLLHGDRFEASQDEAVKRIIEYE